MKKLLIAMVVFSLLVVLPQLVIGAVLPDDNLSQEQESAVAEIESTIGGITSLIRLVGGTIGTLVITAGGVMFMTSGENPERKEQAKQVLTMGVIGLVVILVAPSIVGFIVG
jgi:Na+/proline symporter